MSSSGVSFYEDPLLDVVKLDNVAGAICTKERVILQNKARIFFESVLDDVLELGNQVKDIRDTGEAVFVNEEKFHYVIDATWGHYSRPNVEVIYEPTLLLYFAGPVDFPAVTLVDGPLCSLYPTEIAEVYTLSSVPHTPLGQFHTSEEACAVRDNIGEETIAEKKSLMLEQISHYIPNFQRDFRYVGPQLAIKTKIVGAHDGRNCHVSRNGRVFSVISGKIDAVFSATEQILDHLDHSHKIAMVDSQRTKAGDAKILL